jgi:hypothetical protein
VAELIAARRRFSHSTHGAAAIRQYHEVRDQLLLVLSVAVGFFAGGAVAFAVIGLPGALLAVAIVAALALWALVRGSVA